MGTVVYRSHVTVRRIEGPVRSAKLPAEPDAVTFGVHDEIAAHYKVDPERFPPHAATIDYVVAATCG